MALKRADYNKFQKHRTSQLEVRLQQKLESKNHGKINSLKHTILKYVTEGDYDVAKSELQRYTDMQKNYPAFYKRSERYLGHCRDVIQAVKTKRNFPGIQSLPMAKQQEIFEKVLDHFEELKHYLHKIELTEKDVKLDDLRSTVWVIKTFTYCVFIILLLLFLRYAAISLLMSFEYVIDDASNNFINWVFEFF